MDAPESASDISASDRERLIKAAFAARENAYSNSYHPAFRVGAALLCENGEIVTGASIDCVSSGAICAERTAVVKAVSEGIRAFRAIAITSDVTTPISPCGLCRQVLHEFCLAGMLCLLVPADYGKRRESEGGQGGGVKLLTLGDLLPMSGVVERTPFNSSR